MKRLWQTLMMVRQADPGSFGRKVVYTLLSSVLPLANVYLLKLLVDSVTQGDGRWTVWLVCMTGVFLLMRVVGALDRVNGDVLSQRVIDHVSEVVQRQAARLDLSYYDTPLYHDTLHRAQQEAGTRPIAVLTNAMAVAGALLSTVIVVVMLAQASAWVVPVMLLAVVPSFVVRLRKARSIYRFRRENTQLYRRTAYYSHLLTGREAAAEMRTLRLGGFFRKLFVEARALLSGRLLRISRRLGVADALCGAVEAAAMLAVVWLLASQTLAQALTVGSFVMLFEAFRRGQGYLTGLVAGVAGLYDNRLFCGNLFEFLDLQPTVTAPDAPEPMPERIVEVELCDVTFRYPGMSRDVLNHYNLKARVGEVTRLRGENGAGKSTVLKLLLRLYDPQQGVVRVNGTDVRRFDPNELRSRMGILFQDFMRYECTLRQNVAMGDVEHMDAGVDTALAAAGAERVAGALPHGVDTQLGRMFDGGAELSMGQWQRVALARALQSGAEVLLLDEPTAWLDAATRDEFARSLEELKQERVVIMITHAE